MLLTVRQAQPALFRVPAVPIELVGVGSRTIALDGRQAEQTFRLPAARAPDSVRVDPGATLLLTAEVRR